jgi:aspartate aminotransferase
MQLVRPATCDLSRIRPSNPTGGVATVADLERIAELAKKHDFYVLSDEIYSQLTYAANDVGSAAAYSSILSIPGMADRTIVVDGFSKTWSMTGWRLGWSVMPASLAERVELLTVHAVGCTNSFVQAAGLVALQDEESAGVAVMRVHCRLPEGAFYAFANISAFGMSSRRLSDLLLREGFVAVLPGTDFGDGGEGYIRLSYVSDVPVLEEGLRRIASVLRRLPVTEMPAPESL